MKYDKPLLAVLIGMLAMIPVEILTVISKNIGLVEYTSFEMTSMMLIRNGSWWLGILTGPGTAGLATLILYQAARFLGIDYLYLKGAGIAMITYSWVVIIFGILGRNPNLEMPVISHVINASAAGFGGGLSGFFLKKYLFAHHVKANEGSKKTEVHKYTMLPLPARKQEHSHENNGAKTPKKLKKWKHW